MLCTDKPRSASAVPFRSKLSWRELAAGDASTSTRATATPTATTPWHLSRRIGGSTLPLVLWTGYLLSADYRRVANFCPLPPAAARRKPVAARQQRTEAEA